MNKFNSVARMPLWLKRPIAKSGKKSIVEDSLRLRSLHTVCEEAKCPNRGECFSRGTATFLIMGDVCSRNCLFCGIKNGIMSKLDIDEPYKIAETVRKLNLKYVVVTSVTRDDLPDGGAEHFSKVITEIKKESPATNVEVLVPDFKGNFGSVDTVISAGPVVFNHNIETVERVFLSVRSGGSFSRSLRILRHASVSSSVPVKSGFMVGLGETEKEVFELMATLNDNGVEFLTIGQYLRPSGSQVEVREFVIPEKFLNYKKKALEIGFKKVFSDPFVRSSYRAEDVFLS